MPRKNLVDSSLEEESQSSEDRDATDSEGEGEITVLPSLDHYHITLIILRKVSKRFKRRFKDSGEKIRR
jgi:hypothetical protein